MNTIEKLNFPHNTDDLKRQACAFLRRMMQERKITKVAESTGVKADTLRRHAYGTRWPRLETAMAVLKLRDQIDRAQEDQPEQAA